MLHLRVFGATPAMDEVAVGIAALPGAAHIVHTDAGDGSGRALVAADLEPDAADEALAMLSRLRVPAHDIWLLRLDGVHPRYRLIPRGGATLWADLLGQAGEHARPVARYFVFMAAAGIIAGYGVIYANGILIVGAMAVSPDFLPLASACIGLIAGRRRLAALGLATLAAGLTTAGLVACVLTALLDLTGLLPSSFALTDTGVLAGLTAVNSSTFLVAFVAGIAGLLAIETRASAAVGVAISVTTIPASAYLGVAVSVGETAKAAGAVAVLGVNIAMLLLGGTLTLAVQQRFTARRSP